MSTFCGIISKSNQNESKLPSALTFEDLEQILEMLHKEIKEIELDFNRKNVYIADRELNCAENEKLLLKLESELRNFAKNLATIEQEIAQNEKSLQQIDAIANKIAQKQGTFAISNTLPPNFQSDYARVLANVESLNAQMAQSTACMETIDQFLKTEGALPSSKQTADVITSILGLHLDALENTEKNLTRLDEGCTAVEAGLQLLRQKQLKLFDGE